MEIDDMAERSKQELWEALSPHEKALLGMAEAHLRLEAAVEEYRAAERRLEEYRETQRLLESVDR